MTSLYPYTTTYAGNVVYTTDHGIILQRKEIFVSESCGQVVLYTQKFSDSEEQLSESVMTFAYAHMHTTRHHPTTHPLVIPVCAGVHVVV